NRRDNITTFFNLGRIKVVIGTSTIKEGLNFQENCATLFILTPSWNSTDINQVEGRIHRQGNAYGYARVITPVVARSMDSFIYQKYDEKRSRLADIWKNDGKSDTEDLNIEIKAEKQKELILDNAAEIGRIRGDMKARVMMNLYNKSKEDAESIRSAVRKSGAFSELLSYHLDKTKDMIQCAQENLDVIIRLNEIIKKDEEAKSYIRNLKPRLENLIGYYNDLIDAIKKADESKLAVDVVNIISRSYASRTYYITDNYDTKLELKEYLVENGFKRSEFENLFEFDIFEKVEVYTKIDSYSPKYDSSLKKLKDYYGSSVMAEKLLASEGLSISSTIEELNSVVERYEANVTAITNDIKLNYDIVYSDGKIIPKPEYVAVLVEEARIELDEENKLARSSDELGYIFAEKTNPQLTYLKSDVDLTKCEIHYDECCDTNGKRNKDEMIIDEDVTDTIDADEVPVNETQQAIDLLTDLLDVQSGDELQETQEAIDLLNDLL
ncbi:MAG TPA: helicase-related protein, partial [Chitinophagales bacterium]|nr:helicase-related protein [Chitinophagales bacterium]